MGTCGFFRFYNSRKILSLSFSNSDFLQKAGCFPAQKKAVFRACAFVLKTTHLTENTANRAGHFRHFLIFSITKNDFLHFLSS